MIVFEVAPKTTCKGPYLKGHGLGFLKYYATPGHAPLGQSNVMFMCFKAMSQYCKAVIENVTFCWVHHSNETF